MRSLRLHRLLTTWLLCLAAVLSACASPLEVARTSHEEGRWADVVEALAEEEGRDAEAYVLLGEAQLELGDLDAAAKAFGSARVARDRRPDLEFRTLFGLGNVALLRWDGRTALAFFTDAKVASVYAEQSDACDEGIAYARGLMDEGGDTSTVASRSATERGLPGPPRPLPASPDRQPAPPTGDAVEVIPRAAWGARPMRIAESEPMGAVSRITIHHTGEARRLQPGSRATDAARMRRYQQFHVETRGWADIGYHFVIDPSGRIWEGRPLRYQGAHAGNGPANRHNLGVAVMGNFELGPPDEAQQDALRRLLRQLIREHRIARNGLYTHRAIKKEYDLPGTACPGEHLIRFVEQLRVELAGEFSTSPPREAPWTAGRHEELGSPCPCSERGHRGVARR